MLPCATRECAAAVFMFWFLHKTIVSRCRSNNQCLIDMRVVQIVRSAKSVTLGYCTSSRGGSHVTNVVGMISDSPADLYSCSSGSFGLVLDPLDCLLLFFLLCVVSAHENTSDRQVDVLTGQLARRAITAVVIVFCWCLFS